MMIKRIDLFAPPLGQYGVLNHFTEKLKEAFIRCGVSCRLLTAQRENPAPFLADLLSDPPDCTLSINGLLPDEEGRFFCDLMRIPHVACLVDSPNTYIPLVRSPYTIITCVDRFGCDFFKEIKCDRVLFMPHAVEKNLPFPPEQERPHEVLFLGTCIDYEAIAEEWHKNYPPQICDLLHEAAKETLEQEDLSYVQSFVKLFNAYMAHSSSDASQRFDFLEMLDQLELYLRGLERVNMIKSIHNAHVDIFGGNIGDRGWEHYLKDQSDNVTYHGPVPFENALELMQRSKFLLHSCPWIKYGGHERIFTAMACGAVVLSRPNPFLRSDYSDGEGMIYLPNEKIDDVLTKLLADESQRQHIAKQARQITMNKHTWDHRAAKLLKELPPLIQGIKDTLGVYTK